MPRFRGKSPAEQSCQCPTAVVDLYCQHFSHGVSPRASNEEGWFVPTELACKTVSSWEGSSGQQERLGKGQSSGKLDYNLSKTLAHPHTRFGS